MPNIEQLETAMPVAPMKLLAPEAALPLARKINNYLVNFRQSLNNSFKNDPAFHGYVEDNYLIEVDCPRFGSGEGKGVLDTSVRGKDVFILTDICRSVGFLNWLWQTMTLWHSRSCVKMW